MNAENTESNAENTETATTRERRLQSLAWHRGVREGIRWAQGNADGPLSDPYDGRRETDRPIESVTVVYHAPDGQQALMACASHNQWDRWTAAVLLNDGTAVRGRKLRPILGNVCALIAHDVQDIHFDD
ncbi:hypothetical protein [Bifidobacterium samirii]|uniref:Uncharacterized protein n=1 Tax=Bifidobacterium samirii TaxID=2306974 RepID=A0A430FJN1_9BIFI|nr:hypothetical protein [Bifidobacterium samirii]RSX53010.1 hypothetical protein D2E24_1681 [Bifidobacterium samirii]